MLVVEGEDAVVSNLAIVAQSPGRTLDQPRIPVALDVGWVEIERGLSAA